MAIVTTSGRTKSKNKSVIPLIIIIAVLAAAVVYLLLRKPESATGTVSSAIESEATLTASPSSEKKTVPDKVDAKADSKKTGASNRTSQESNFSDSDPSEADAESNPASSKPVEDEEKKPKPMPYGVLSKQHFDNPVENRLEKLGIPGNGVAMSLPNKLSNEEVMEILKRPIQINEDDDEETVAAKERTAAMKTEALKYIEEGGTYDEFLAEMTKISNEEYALKTSARSEMMRILKTEGYEAAEAYLEQVNPSLKDAGLKEMKIPLPFRVKHQKELERAEKGN